MPKAAVFVAVVDNGSFVAAGRALGMARSTISEHVSALETALDVRLLERTTRRLRLTEEGELLYAQMTGALTAWQDATSAFDERRAEPVGTLRITTPGGLATSVVAPVLVELLAEHPRLETELVTDDRFRDLVAEGIDVAVRMSPLQDSQLVARRLGEDTLVFVAAPALAGACRGGPEALARYPWVGHANLMGEQLRVREVSGEREQRVKLHYRARASTAEGQLALTIGGLGITQLPESIARPGLEDGRLVRVFEGLCGGTVPIFAVYPQRRHLTARVRVFLERLQQVLG